MDFQRRLGVRGPPREPTVTARRPGLFGMAGHVRLRRVRPNIHSGRRAVCANPIHGPPRRYNHYERIDRLIEAETVIDRGLRRGAQRKGPSMMRKRNPMEDARRPASAHGDPRQTCVGRNCCGARERRLKNVLDHTVRVDGRPHMSTVVAVVVASTAALSTSPNGAEEQAGRKLGGQNPHVAPDEGLQSEWDHGLDVVSRGKRSQSYRRRKLLSGRDRRGGRTWDGRWQFEGPCGGCFHHGIGGRVSCPPWAPHQGPRVGKQAPSPITRHDSDGGVGATNRRGSPRNRGRARLSDPPDVPSRGAPRWAPFDAGAKPRLTPRSAVRRFSGGCRPEHTLIARTPNGRTGHAT